MMHGLKAGIAAERTVADAQLAAGVAERHLHFRIYGNGQILRLSRRHLIVDHAGDAFDVQPARRHVRGHQDAVGTVLEPVQSLGGANMPG